VAESSLAAVLAEARELYGVFGKSARALEVVNRALAFAPADVEALNLKAAILYELDRDEEARGYHLLALKVEPHSVEALHGLAAMANDARRHDDALEWVERGLRSVPRDPYREFIENADYRQRLVAELYNEKATALWYLGRKREAVRLLTEEAPRACPLEVENFEDHLDWLEHDADAERE